MELDIIELYKKYGKKTALNGITHTFKPGITAVLGPNGSGKTTMMNLLCDIVKRDGGEILFDGEEILNMGKRFRKILGFMPQEQGYYPDMTTYEFLCYIAGIKEIPESVVRKQIPELMENLNLSSFAYKKIGNLSGGMKQRVILAQALLGSPKILLLDEPSAGLDPEERIRLQHYIREYSKEKITLISTHITSDVETCADFVLLLKNGDIITSADMSEFLAEHGNASLEQAYLGRIHADA